MVSPALIIALLISSIWLAYVAFYNSRVQGIVCTWILRHLGYIKNAEVKFGSISISILGGKIMFRELRYITKDFALRSVDGAFIFKWFTRLSPDDISRAGVCVYYYKYLYQLDDASGVPENDSEGRKSESQTWSLYHIIFQSRALLTLHGLEMHIYNRTSLYDDLEKVAKSEMDVGMPEDRLPDPDSKTPEPVVEDNSHSDKWGLRNLIPVLVVEVQKGKFVVGNNLTETVMFVDIETATAIYSTPSSKKQQLDPYMHMIRSKINKIRITLNKSPGFKGLYETPPSQPEAGVPLLRSREVRVQYIQDMPGRVTKLQRSAESSPEWEMTLKFMRETHIYYGPWIDRQRDILYKFFFPYDYKVAEVSKPLKVGDLRRHQHMNVIIDFEAKATLTILFFREEATSSINLDIANGSRVQMQIPWTTTPQGFTTQIVADLYKVECQTSLDYRPFLEADEVHAIFTFQYPRVWHHRQSWECDFFNVSRPTLHFVFDHVAFMTDLLDDWGPVTQPDLLSFVPYVWRFDFKFTDALVVLPVSQHNWVDCIQNRIENSETVFFGLHCDILDIHFELPWTNYQPATTEIRFDFNAEDITGSIWLPKYHTLRDSLKQFNMGKFPAWLERAHVDKVGEETGSSNKDKNVSAHDLEGWEECWSLQDLFLRFTFLSNSALPFERPGYQYNMTPEDKTNHLGVEVMLGPSVIRLHGVFFRHLWFFKDNYFGYDDKCTPLAYLYNRALIDKNKNPRVKRPTKECPMYDLDVNCKVIVKDILGEFPRHCDEPNDQIKLPIAQIDGIVFELTKTRHEAKMELTISPITFLFSDSFKRPTLDMHLAHGFLQLQGINVIMCGLYSGVGINNPKNPFDFLEYAFLVEVTTGALVGKLTVPHIQKLVHWLEIFLWQSLDRENEMPTTEHQINIEQVHSSTHRADIVQTDGHTSSSFSKLRSSQQKKLKTDDLKYLMIKVSVAHTDLYVVEAGCACKIATKSIRIALCNAHDENTTLGVTVCVQGADVTQYVRLPNDEDKVELENKSQWLEAGVLSLPPVMFDVNKRLGDPCLYKREQREFLKCHDKVNQCLLFLWMPEEYKGCGCVGGVAFNNTTLIEVNGFYFEPVVVPPDFCQSASPSSNTPWKLGRGASVVMTDGSSRTSPGSSVSSRQSDKRKHVSELLNSQGFGGLSPADAKPKRRPPTGKKKTKGRDSGEWFTTFPQRSGRKPRDKQKTLSHYNDLLKNFSIKRNISRLSSKRKSKGSDAGGSEHSFSQQEPVLKVDNEEEAEKDGREEKEDIYSSTPSIAVRSPSVSGTAPTVVDPNAMKGSSESLELSAPQEYESAEDEAKRSSKQSLSLQSPGSGSKNEDRSSSLGRRSKSRGGTLSRSSSQDSFKSARSEFRHTDAASSAAEEEADTTEAEDEENQVKDLSIPFPFPKAADHALNHELIDIYRDHLPHAWLTETRYSNTVVLNKSYSDLAEVDMNKIPHRISPHKRQSRGSKGSKGSKESDVPPVEPAIHELLQIVKYILPDFHPDSAGSTSSDVTSDNLFSSDSFSDTKSDPRLLELRRKWEKKLKEKKVSTDDTSETDSSVTDGKVICVAEIVDPVDLFFTPFCVHAVNKYIETAEAYYRDLHPAAVVNLVQAATAPTVLEIAIQHATAQKALLFSNHLQPIGMKKFDNSLERTIEERLNLELFLYIPVVSIRTLQGGGDLQWVGTEAELETARSKAQVPFKSGSKSSSKDHGFKDQGAYTTDDDALTDRSESARSDISLDPSSGKGSSNVICPNKIAKLSLIKCVANNIDVSFSYHQFESQKPMGSGGGRNKSVMESALPGEYTQTAFKASVDGIYGQLHILHPMIGKQSDTFIPYTKTRMVAARKIKDNVQKLSSRETSVVIELGAEKCKFSGGSLKRNLLVALPEPPEQQKPKKKEEEKQDIPSFALDGDSIDIELGKQETSSSNIPFKYKKLRPKASIHYHSGPDRMSLNSSVLDEAQEPLISGSHSSLQSTRTSINQTSSQTSPVLSPVSLTSIHYHNPQQSDTLPYSTVHGVEHSKSETGDVSVTVGLDPGPSRRLSMSLPNISSSVYSVDIGENDSEQTIAIVSEEGDVDGYRNMVMPNTSDDDDDDDYDERIAFPNISDAYKDMAEVGPEVVQVNSRTDFDDILVTNNALEKNVTPIPTFKISATPSCVSNLPFSSSNVSIDSRIEALGSRTRIKLPPVESDYVHKIQSAAIPELGKKESKIRHNSIFHALSKIRRPSFGVNKFRQTSTRDQTEGVESDDQSEETDNSSSTIEDIEGSTRPHFNRTTTVDFVDSFPTYKRGRFEDSLSPRKESLLPSIHLPGRQDNVRPIQSAASPLTLGSRHNSIFGTLPGQIRKLSSVRSRAKSSAFTSSPREIVHLHQVENAASFLQYSQAETRGKVELIPTNYGIDYYQSTVEDPRSIFPDPSNFSTGIDGFASTFGHFQPELELGVVNNIPSNVGRQSVFYDAEEGLFDRESREHLAKAGRKKEKKTRSGKRLRSSTTGRRYQQIVNFHRHRTRKQSLFTRILQQSAFYKNRDEDGISSEKVSMGAEVAASLTTLTNTYNDKSSINGHISELWIQIATPSAEKTDSNLFNPYTSLPHAVFSWSEPGSLFAQHLTQLFHHKLSRVQAVIAALLAEALGQETQYEPPNYTTKHSRLTIASKTLKESAVIRLMNQLRYTLDICKDTNTDLYNDLKQDFVPRRIILERGVQSMLAAIEGNLLLTTDSLMDNMSVQAPPTSHQSPPSNHLPDVAMSDKTPVYYVGKQDYGSIAALDKISIGKPPQNVQVEAKHRTHRHALIEMSSSDKAKLAEKYFALYQALQLRLPKTDHVNHQLKMEIDGTSIIAIDCHRDLTSDAVVSPFFNAKNFFLETSLFPAQKEFSIPRHSKKGVHKRSDSRSSSGVTEGRTVHRSDSTDSLFSKRSSMSGRHHPASSPPGSGPPPRPPRKKKSKKFLDVQLAQNVKKSISHVVKHLVINTQIETCVTEINLDLLRLSKALVDGMSNFQPGSFHPALGDSAVLDGSGPPSPTGDPPLRSVEDQFALAGAWEKMDEYIQLMFRGDPTVTRTSSDSSRPVKPRIDRDVMLYSEAPDIPLSVTATWRFDNAEIIGRLQGLRAHINVGSISGAAAILQNLYVEMNNSPNSDIILEPLSPNIISGNLDETNIAVNFYDEETKQDCQLICVDVPTLNTVYSFLPHVTRIQKMFINVTELKAKVPKPIVEIKNVLLISTKLVLHEIKSFERYFQSSNVEDVAVSHVLLEDDLRALSALFHFPPSLHYIQTSLHSLSNRPQQSLQRIHIENPNKQTEIDLNLVIRAASIDLYILPSLSLKHGIGDLHVRFAQNKGQTAQLDIHHHELSLNAKEIDLHTHLPLPQIFIRIEKVKKRDPSGIRSGIHGEHYTGVVEIKTFQLQLPTTMLNHVLLVQNAFMKEINEFLDTINLIRYTVEKTSPIAKSSSLPTSAHMVPFAFTMKLQGIDLLATTPSDLAMSLKTETINVEVKNRMVTERITVARDREQIIERPRMFISTMITTDITLGQLADIDPGVPRSSEEDMVKFLQFRATASLGNNEGLFENKLSSSESFHATISNPQLFMQPGAFDKALLFYLNFKTAYAIFNDDRQKLNDETVTATETFKNRFNLPEGPPVLPSNTQLKMTVRNLAVCLPIQKSSVLSPTEELLSASQTDLVKYSPGDGALSISIKTAEMKMAFGVIHNNKGLFNDFVIRFIDEFDEKKWMENAAPRSAEKELNSISIDSGNYDYTTLTTSTTGSLKEAGIEGEQSGKMTVGVISDIKGVNVHLSTNIITKLVGLYKTLTSIVGTDDPKDDGIEPIDETELVKNLGVQSAEKGQFNEEEAVKIWKRTALHADKKDKEKLERTTSGAKRKKQQASGTQGDKERKQPDEVSMYSTRTSKSVLRDEESVSSSVGSTLPSQALEPPLLEFQLDLDLRLGNGRITLYPTSKTDESMSKKGRFQGRFNESQDFVTDNTEFLIPETRCELHYTSSKLTEKSSVHAGVSGGVVTSATSRVSAETTTSGSDESGTKSIKTGSLYSSVRVLSLKQDQIIRPCLLEYLDQLLSKDKNLGSPSSAGALQTFIPEEIEEILKDPKRSKTAIEEAKTSPTPSSEHSSCKPAPTDTFPVDIIIMVMVEPSTIKLSCQPFSRHECSLVVPRSCFLLSTKGTPSQVLLTAATGRKEVPIIRDGSTSCWNVTWCLEQCKLSLYHPLSAMSSYQQSQSLPSRAEVRNALSVTIGGGNVAVTRITTPKELTNSEGVSIPGHNPKKLIAHISSMLDIGKVDLTYDIKRMDEVESFHNAWLSGEFIKRILLLSRPIGEMGSQDAPVSSPPLSPSSQPKPLTRSDRFYSTYEKPRTETYFSLPRNPQALREIREESPKPSSPAPGKPPVTGPASTVTTRSSDTTEPEIAETNLMLAINSREITLTTNLGHTLGRINISIANSMNSTTLCLKERHNEQRKVDVLIGKVLLESTAGLITGLVKVENLAGIFEHCISPEKTPTHSLKVYFECFENKLEYLSNCIHMLRITGFCTELTDRWKEKEGDSHLSVGGSIRWDLVQTMIHCNTAPNLLQIKAHLNEFIVHQKKYSQRTYLKLLNLEPEEKEHHVIPLKQYELEAQVLAHHWFWAVDPHSTFDSIKVLLESGLFLKPLKLGGSLKINGEQFSVALFQGEKFRDDTWALINLNKIGMRYDTQVEQLMKGTQTSRVTKQQAVIVMGDFEPEEIASLKLKAPNNSIGLVEKCVRSTKLSPPERTDDIKKWLQYACTHDFAHGNPDKERKTRATIFGGGSVEFSTIFQLPEMKLNLTTDHNWEGAETGSPTSNRSVHHLPVPIVNCRLRSHFRGSIGLATNAGNYFFLHDLAQRYTKKMEIYMEANPIFAFEKKPSEPQVSSTGYSETAESTEDTQKYAREFVCEEWELKPPLRLQGGGKVEVNVDWVLNKLGFKNPTVTIPKWIQRGPMDPLDYFISGLVKTLVFQQAEIISELKSLKKS